MYRATYKDAMARRAERKYFQYLKAHGTEDIEAYALCVKSSMYDKWEYMNGLFNRANTEFVCAPEKREFKEATNRVARSFTDYTCAVLERRQQQQPVSHIDAWRKHYLDNFEQYTGYPLF